MKKMLSIILVLSLMISSCFVFSASAADAATEGGFGFSVGGLLAGDEAVDAFKDAINNYDPSKMPAPDTENVEELLAVGALDNCSMLGITVDFLYNSTKELEWGHLYELDENGNIIFYDENGVEVPQSAGGKPKVVMTKGDMSLANANLNVYLKRLMTNKYGGFNLFTAENATAITNFLGNLFYPNYKDQVISFPGTQSVSESQFYKTIVSNSGFAYILQENWCNQSRMNFKPMLTLFGVSLDDVLESEYKNGQILGEKILAAALSKIISGGPLAFILDLIWAYSRAYESALYEPTAALLALKINQGIVSYEEIKTFDGLLNLLVNGCNYDDPGKLQFLTTPVRRFAMAKDTNELFLYLLVYLNLNCRYKNNSAVISSYVDVVNKWDIDDTDKSRIENIINGLLSGRIDILVDDLGELYKENIDKVPVDFWTSFAITISKFIQKIADFFDNWFKILTGEKNFGT